MGSPWKAPIMEVIEEYAAAVSARDAALNETARNGNGSANLCERRVSYLKQILCTRLIEKVEPPIEEGTVVCRKEWSRGVRPQNQVVTEVRYSPEEGMWRVLLSEETQLRLYASVIVVEPALETL